MAAKTQKEAGKEREVTQARVEALAKQLLALVDKKQNPFLEIPVRGSANVEFDAKQKKIVLGSRVAKRYLFNVAHARRFMQTMLVASYVKKDLLGNDLTATLRDLYYAKKRTIRGTNEETIAEQKESDLAIVDLEVALDSFRERLHLRAEPKGRMAGNMVIEDRVRDKKDLIDLSKMGSGGWAIPSIVEQIDFKNVDVEYVLVAEKNALFDRLNEDRYWQKNKCLIMTTAGQAARGARRFLRRLNDELGLPIYILSVDGREPLMVRDYDGLIRRPLIGDYVNAAMLAYGATNRGEYEKCLAFGTTLQVDAQGTAAVSPIVNAVRHEIREPLVEVEAESGFSARVTKSHSLKVFDAERFEIVSRRAGDLKPTDYLVSPARVPTTESLRELDVFKLALADPQLSAALQGRAAGSVAFQPLAELQAEPAELRAGQSELHFKPRLALSPEFGRLLGYYASEGHFQNGGFFTFGPHEEGYASDAAACAKAVFGVPATRQAGRHSLRVAFGGKFAELVLEKLLNTGRGAENKRVPWVVYNALPDVKKEFLRGYFRGDGSLRFSKRGCTLWAKTVSRPLAADLVFLVRQLGGWATVGVHRSKKPNAKDAYVVGIRDKKTLRILRDTVLDLAKDRRDAVWEYLESPVCKLAVNHSVPAPVVKRVQRALYAATKRGTSPLVNTQTRIAFDKLRPIVARLAESPSSVLVRDRILDSLPLDANAARSTRAVAEQNGVPFITAFKSLKRLEKSGFVAGVRVRGDWRWFRTRREPVLSAEDVRRLLVLKNLVDNALVLLKPKRVREVEPSTRWVYDVEVSPSHSFTTGVGDLLVSNTDADPYGWYIYSTMKYGSMALAHESERLGCPNAHFIGLSMSDIEHYDLRSVTIKAKDVDIKRAQEMREYAWFKNKPWQAEIDKFLEKKIKAEIQSLSSKSLQYVSNTYLPEKIKSQDFLP